MSAILLASAAAALVGLVAGFLLAARRRPRHATIDPAGPWLADVLPGHGWSNDPDGNFTAVSPGLLAYFGFGAAYFDRKTGTADFQAAYRDLERALVHPDDVEAARTKWRRSLATGEPFINEHRLRRADGVYRWYRVVAICARDSGGRILSWSGIGFDIEDEKRAETALRRREVELQRLIDTVPAQIWRASPEGEANYFSARLREFIGVAPDDFVAGPDRLAQSNRWLFHSDDFEAAHGSLLESLAAGTPFRGRFRLRRADGVYRWTEHRAEPLRDDDGQIIEWYGVCLDIDEQVRAEAAVRRNEQRLARLIDTVPAAIWRATPAGVADYMSPRLHDFVGMSLEEFSSGPKRFGEGRLIHPDDRDAARSRLHGSLASGTPFTARFRLRRADGVYRWTEHRAEPLRDADGQIIEWYGVCFDIDDMVQAEAQLRIHERELRNLVDTIPAMLWSSPALEGPFFMSSHFTNYTQYTPEDYLAPGGTDPERFRQELIHPDEGRRVGETYAWHFVNGLPVSHRYRLRRGDGAWRWVESRCAALRDESGKVLGRYGIMIDVDDEVQSQRALVEARDRLARASQAASLSELSASIAHEVNQPLAAVVANARACQNWLAADPPNLDRARATTERVIGDANAAAEVVARISALFRRTPARRAAEDVNRIIAEACDLVREEAAVARVGVELRLAPGLPPARVDRVQIQQVVVNLVRNGVEATPPGPDSAPIVVETRLEGEEVVVAVGDRGVGFADPGRAFEPFVTTKVGGMGMGLAIARSVVETHEGRIAVTANAPRGTTVAFALPIDAALPQPAEALRA